jgi:ABC-type glycerol-3-phosphate transport system substrate-binding protein
MGLQYSVSWGICPLTIVANKRLVGEGTLPDGEPLTIQEFSELCERIETDYLDADTAVFGFSLSKEETDFLTLIPFLRAFGGDFTDRYGNLVFNSPENREAFGWLRWFFQTRRTVYSDIFDLRRRLAAGRVAMLVDGPWIKLHMEEATGRPFDEMFILLLQPAGKGGASLSLNFNHALCVTSQCRRRRYAAKLVTALSSDPEISTLYYREVGHLPPIESDRSAALLGETAFYTALSRQAETSMALQSRNALFDKAVVFAGDAVHNILFSSCDIAEELAEKQKYLDLLYRE